MKRVRECAGGAWERVSASVPPPINTKAMTEREALLRVARAADRLVTEFWGIDPTLGPDIPWRRLTALARALGQLKSAPSTPEDPHSPIPPRVAKLGVL